MIVKNIVSIAGRPVVNQFIVECEGRVYFQSYKSVIAMRNSEGEIYLDQNLWDYSRTTSKYRNIFLGEDTKTTLCKIASGEYMLVDLNNGVKP